MLWTSLLAGFGGLLPTLSKIAGSFAAQPEQPLPHIHILIALFIFFLLGFVLNISFNKDKDVTKAIIIGISAPGLITNIYNGVANAPKQPPSNPVAGSSSTPPIIHGSLTFITPAFAQTSNTASPAPATSPNAGSSAPTAATRSVTVNTILGGPYGYTGVVDDPVVVSFYDSNGDLKYQFPMRAGSSAVFTVPDSATTVDVQSLAANSKIALPTNTPQLTVNAQLYTVTSAIDDFKWALGGNRAGQIRVIKLNLSPTLKNPGAP